MTVLLNNPTLAPLLRSPRLVFYVQELHDLLAIKAQTGELHSNAVPGFVIPVRAIFDDEMNQATLRQLLAA